MSHAGLLHLHIQYDCDYGPWVYLAPVSILFVSSSLKPENPQPDHDNPDPHFGFLARRIYVLSRLR